MIDLHELDQYRDPIWEWRVSPNGGNRWPRDCGCFQIPSPIDQQMLRCLVSSGRMDVLTPWDHVSVSRADRCPDWTEMDYLARLLFRPNEVAMQLHVPAKDHVNCHPNCLHLWRPAGLKRIPLPPSILVGPDTAKGKRA